ncbi:MAG: bifunctional folylpolyglutamate synthase/dihydrofolate synthase [Thomasclavelia sp.]
MFNDIESALKYIESRRVKRTTKQFKDTIKKYGFNIHQKNMIHVAGTNGKGSTVNFIKEILVRHGFRVGTFTSPYLICHNDRICINGKMISDAKLLQIINDLVKIIESEQLSMFEIDILIMLKYFEEEDLDYRIIETGIGGLNDKTNVIDSICSVITNIGYDHQFMLGDTLEKIAKHKAGIIKANQICFTSETNPDLIAIFDQKAISQNSQLIKVMPVCNYQYPYHFSCLNHDYYLTNCGSYQVANATLAINVCNHLIKLKQNLVQEALSSFKWPGRFEQFGKIYLDGAHNLDGIKALIKTLHDQKVTNALIIFSALGDKDIKAMKELLSEYPLIQATFEDERLELDGIDFKQAIDLNYDLYDHLIITGSLHFISTVRKYLLTR